MQQKQEFAKETLLFGLIFGLWMLANVCVPYVVGVLERKELDGLQRVTIAEMAADESLRRHVWASVIPLCSANVWWGVAFPPSDHRTGLCRELQSKIDASTKISLSLRDSAVEEKGEGIR